ncbi:MAG: thioredoxin family protein [Desulfosoma sp.]
MKSVRQLRIGTQTVGLVGLDEALQETALCAKAGRSPDEIKESLLQLLAKDNYIPSGARADYAKALYREWQRFVGEPVTEDEPPQEMSVLVVGPGCAQCDALERAVMDILNEEKISVSVDHVRDPVAIGEMGILGVPALVVGRQVLFSGRVPPKPELKKRLVQALKSAAS